MNWTFGLVGLVMVVAFIALQRLGRVSVKEARGFLERGALVLDVRSASEFKAGHLPGAVNVPLDQVRDRVPRQAPDREQVLLLHCLSGTRSGIARRVLRGMGYRNVYNLGSYARAESILASGRIPGPAAALPR